jgi:hypothetical protein
MNKLQIYSDFCELLYDALDNITKEQQTLPYSSIGNSPTKIITVDCVGYQLEQFKRAFEDKIRNYD